MLRPNMKYFMWSIGIAFPAVLTFYELAVGESSEAITAFLCVGFVVYGTKCWLFED